MDVQPPSSKYMVWIEYVILHQKNDKVNHGTIPAIHMYPHDHLRQRRSEVLPTQNGLVSRTMYRTPWFLGSNHPPRRKTCLFKMSTLRCDFSYERNIEAWISHCQKQGKNTKILQMLEMCGSCHSCHSFKTTSEFHPICLSQIGFSFTNSPKPSKGHV